MKQKYLLILLLVLAVLIAFLTLNSPKVAEIVESEPINLADNPIQQSKFETYNIPHVEGNINVMMKAQAKYKISARVLHTRNYHLGWTAKLAPVDLALGWGKMAEDQYLKFIKIRQSNRFYYYKYKAESPLRKGYISSHSCNNHIIPANENLRKALKSIKKNDIIEIEGYLVNIRGTYKNQKVWWTTSLNRRDTGDGACELIFAEKIRIKDKIYE